MFLTGLFGVHLFPALLPVVVVNEPGGIRSIDVKRGPRSGLVVTKISAVPCL